MINDTSKLREFFLGLGYSERDYKRIIQVKALQKYSEETLMNKVNEVFDYLSNYYSEEEIIKITTSNPQIFSLLLSTIESNIKCISDIGYGNDSYKMIKSLPQLLGLSDEGLKDKIEYMMSKGFKKEEIIKITKKFPQIFGYSIDNIESSLLELENMGFSKETINNMIKSFPQILGLSNENKNNKLDFICSLGYTREETCNMIKELPPLFGLTNKNIKEKIDFYDSIGMHKLLIIDPSRLKQSTALSYARYMFFNERGINIDINNYMSLYMNNKRFEKKYNITKEELLKKYDYNKYIDEKNGIGGLK